MPVNDRRARSDDDDDDTPPRRPRRGPDQFPLRPLLYVLLVVFGVGAGMGVFWLGGQLLNKARRDTPAATNPDAKPKEAVANAPLDGEETEAHALFEGDKDSVVNVDTVLLKRGQFDDRAAEQQTGTGSGFVWDADGRIVTNYHVIEDATKRPNMAIRVVMADRRAYDGRIVGTAPDYDLAVVQMLNPPPKEKLRPIQVATSTDLKVGQKVFAIGNPFGLSLTLTTGIISNVDRTIEAPTGAPIPGAIQHTAQINPGNSGGPLLNRAGKLIGVNTSITTPSGGNVGIGFSIPSDTVNQVVTEIVRTGRTARPDLGVRLYDQKKLRRAGYEKGVMIAEVIPNGSADRAKLHGLRRNPETGKAEPGDIILAINGEEVPGVDDFQRVVAKLKPGQQVQVRYLRDEVEREVTLTVGGV
ncbi:MAG: degQ 2 [Gemmataceae bacterium]|nr:degQ 2 [Gemmataceae bacterium]